MHDDIRTNDNMVFIIAQIYAKGFVEITYLNDISDISAHLELH